MRFENFQKLMLGTTSGSQKTPLITSANPISSGVPRITTIPETPVTGIHASVDCGINSEEDRAKINELAEAKLNGRET